MNCIKINFFGTALSVINIFGCALSVNATSYVSATSQIHDEFTAVYDAVEFGRELIDGRLENAKDVAIFRIRDAQGEGVDQSYIDDLYPVWGKRLSAKNLKQPGKYEGVLRYVYPKLKDDIAFFWINDSRVSFSRDDMLNYCGGNDDSGYPRSGGQFGVYLMTGVSVALADAPLVTNEDIKAMPLAAPYLGMRVLLKQPSTYLIPGEWASDVGGFLERWVICDNVEKQRDYLRAIYQSTESYESFSRLGAWLYIIQFTESEKLISQLSPSSFSGDEFYLATFTYSVMRYGSSEEKEAFMSMVNTTFGGKSDWAKFGLRGLALGAMNVSVKSGNVRRSVANNMEPKPQPMSAALRLLTDKVRAVATDVKDASILKLLRDYADDTGLQPPAKLPDRLDRFK